MHTVDIWTVKSALRKAASIREPTLVVGYGRPLLRIVPQIRGCGYGLTVMTLSGRVLLEADLTGPPAEGEDLKVLTVAKRATYRVSAQRRTRSR